MNTTEGYTGQGVTTFEIWAALIGFATTSIFAYFFYKFNKKLQDWEYRYINKVPLPPVQLKSPRRTPPKDKDWPDELDKTNLTSIVVGIREHTQNLQSDIEHLERDLNHNYKRVRQLSDENEEIDETLGEFRSWMKRTKEVLKDHERRIDDLTLYFDRHERDLEAIAFSPSKTVPNSRFEATSEGDLSKNSDIDRQ